MQHENEQHTSQHEDQMPMDAHEEAVETAENQPVATEPTEAQADEMKDKYLRLYADFENFRRRTAREKMEFLQTAEEGMMTAILPVLDDFERAIKFMDQVQDVAVVKQGVQLIYQKLYKALESRGLTPMEAVGKEFDSESHEAITQIPAPTDDLKGKVVDEVERGYTLREKIIRFAKVVVGI